MPSSPTPQLDWFSLDKTLTLEGRPVLEYHIFLPKISRCGPAGCFLSAYYRRMGYVWERRWQHQVYLRSCLDLSSCERAGRPFTPWQGSLKGELTLLQSPFLSLRFTGIEVQGRSGPCRVTWGEVWNYKTGQPCHWRDFLPRPNSKSRLSRQIVEQGREQAAGAARFFHPGWEPLVEKLLPGREFWLTPEHLHLCFPQCTLSPAAEGTPEFHFPRQ